MTTRLPLPALLLALILAAAAPAATAVAGELVPLAYAGMGPIQDIDRKDGVVALAVGNGVELLASGPGGYTRLAHLDFAAWVADLEFDGTHLYLLLDIGELHVVDATDPAVPTTTGIAAIIPGGGYYFVELAVAGDVAVARRQVNAPNVFLLDVADPADPVVASALELATSQPELELGPGHLYYASTHVGLQTWSVSDPYAPVLTSAYDGGDSAWRALSICGERLYADGTSLAVFSLADPAVPAVQSQQGQTNPFFYFEDCHGDHLYRSPQDHDYLEIFDATDPFAPVRVDSLPGLGGRIDATSGELNAGSGTLLRRFSLADPAAPVETAAHHTPSELDMDGADGRLWVATGPAGLVLLDLDAAGVSTRYGPWAVGGTVTRVAVDGMRLALIDTAGTDVDPPGIRVLDVTTPTAPAEIAAIPLEDAVDVDIEGEVVVATVAGGLRVIDLSAGPASVLVPLPGAMGRVALDAGHAYVGNPADLVTQVDVTDPSAPVDRGPLPIDGMDHVAEASMDIDVEDGLAVVSSVTEPLVVLDVEDPQAPVQLASFFLAGGTVVLNLELGGRWLLVANYLDARLVDLVDPANPEEVVDPTTLPPGPSQTMHLAAWPGEARGALGISGGIVIVEPDVPDVTAAPEPAPATDRLGLALVPNPANPRVSIAWELPRSGPLQVEVFDLAGRRVARLLDETREAGPGEIVWDGRDARGRAVSSGVYLVRVRSAASAVSRTVTIVR